MSITETGYHRKTFEEILSDLTLKAQELFGEDIDVSDQSYFGKLLNIMAFVRAKDHEEAELIYYSRFPNSASGTNLDRLCPFVGITRNVATPARYKVTVSGAEGTTIPIGFLVSTDSGIEYYTTMEETIPKGETSCEISVECTTAGTIGNVIASDITEVVNPEAGIDSVIGKSIVSLGEDEESDYDLRKRFLAAVNGGGTGNNNSIRAAILKVPTVTSAIIIENDTDETDSNGIPPHSIACYVSGGEGYEQEIGEAIFSSKAIGIGTYGSISTSVIDSSGYPHTIKYNTTENISIVVSIRIKTTSDFEGDTGIASIKDNIKSYINELGTGGDVILTSLYGHIYSVKGVENVTSLTLNGGTSDIVLTGLQYPTCTEVSVTEE